MRKDLIEKLQRLDYDLALVKDPGYHNHHCPVCGVKRGQYCLVKSTSGTPREWSTHVHLARLEPEKVMWWEHVLLTLSMFGTLKWLFTAMDKAAKKSNGGWDKRGRK